MSMQPRLIILGLACFVTACNEGRAQAQLHVSLCARNSHLPPVHELVSATELFEQYRNRNALVAVCTHTQACMLTCNTGAHAGSHHDHHVAPPARGCTGPGERPGLPHGPLRLRQWPNRQRPHNKRPDSLLRWLPDSRLHVRPGLSRQETLPSPGQGWRRADLSSHVRRVSKLGPLQGCHKNCMAGRFSQMGSSMVNKGSASLRDG